MSAESRTLVEQLFSPQGLPSLTEAAGDVTESERDYARFRSRLLLVIGSESHRSFARRAGLHDASFRRYLTGSDPTRQNLVRLARAANVSVSWLATGEGEP